MITIHDAVKSLRPGAEWTMNGDDVEGMVWHTQGIEPITQAEAEAEMARLTAEAVERETAAAAARAAAIAHAKSLGFTDDMIAVMYPNLQMGA